MWKLKSWTQLQEIMKSKGFSTYKIRQNKIISESTMQNLRDGKDVSTDAISKLCDALGCKPGDFWEQSGK
jgi:putative transcriptional regulator